MEKIRLGLLEERKYAECFAEYVNQKHYHWMELFFFTSIESIRTFIENEKIDILLAGEKFCDRCRKLSNIHQLVLLAEGECVREGRGYPLIFKYQSIENILKDIFDVITEDENLSIPKFSYTSKNTKFIGVFSLSEMAESSMYARELAKKKARIDKTLYIDLHPFSCVKKERGMSEVIFYTKQKKEKLALKIHSLIRSEEGVDTICPVEDYRDLYSMTNEDIHKLLQVLSCETEYETMIFDVGFQSEASTYLLQCCDQIFCKRAEQKLQKRFEQSFEQMLQREGLYDVMGQVQFF